MSMSIKQQLNDSWTKTNRLLHCCRDEWHSADCCIDDDDVTRWRHEMTSREDAGSAATDKRIWQASSTQTRDAREWLFTFPLPPIPVQSIPILSHSHSQFCNQFPFPWDSHKAFPIPSHFHSRTLHRCSMMYFWAREDSSLNMPLKLTISCVNFYSTETRKIVVENIIFLSCNIIAYYHNKLTINCTIT